LGAHRDHRIDLLDHPRLLTQLVGVERNRARGGRDSIDHTPGAHDDLANAVAGLCNCTRRNYAYDSTMSWVSRETMNGAAFFVRDALNTLR
jgi:hypothetical protein